MTFLEPLWLILALPLAAALVRFAQPSRFLNLCRAAFIVLVVLALAGLSLRWPSRVGMVVVVADRSRSMPIGSGAAHRELIDLLQSSMPEGGRVAVVSFGEGAAVERAAEGGAFPGFLHELGGDGSSLAEGIDTALSLVPKDSPGRILVLSDGRWTGRDPAALAGLAADRGIAIDYRHRDRSGAGDLAISLVDAPSSAAAGEGFLITAWVRSPLEQDVRFELTRGATVIASGTKRLASGADRLTFRDRAEAAGSQGYQLRRHRRRATIPFPRTTRLASWSASPAPTHFPMQ